MWPESPSGWGVDSHRFPNAWLDIGSTYMPSSISQVLQTCEFIFMSNGIYRMAVDRVLSYFITDVEVEGDTSDEERDKWRILLNDKLGIRSALHSAGLDWMCYGNGFLSFLPRFNRYLFCPRQGCGFGAPLREIYRNDAFGFSWTNFEFHAQCPRCNERGAWQVVDRRLGGVDSFYIKRWNPHEMEILHDRQTGQCAYIWKIPAEYRRQIREGKLFHLERAAKEVIRAVSRNEDLMFEDGVIYHMKEEPLAGIDAGGWGVSRVLANFRQAWYVQLMHRHNETVALDHMLPVRLITPAPGRSGVESDPMLTGDLSLLSSQVRSIIRKHRVDPASWHTLPYAVQYQALGAEGKILTPYELLNQGLDTLLNAIGVPVELYKGTLQIQAAPAALRLFEATWSALPQMFNRFLNFLAEQIAQYMSWEPVKLRLERVRYADDLQRQQTLLQLMMSGLVGPSTGLRSLGLAYREELRRALDDERIRAEETARLQEAMEMKGRMKTLAQPQGPGVPPAGQPVTAPVAAGQNGQASSLPLEAQLLVDQLPLNPHQPITPHELQVQAQRLASQLFIMDESLKDSELIRLKKIKPTLPSQVLIKLPDMRQRLKTQGGAMLREQMRGAALTSGAPLPQ